MNIAITGASGFIGTNFIREYKSVTISDIDILNKKLNDYYFKKLILLSTSSLWSIKCKAPQKKNIFNRSSLRLESSPKVNQLQSNLLFYKKLNKKILSILFVT